MQSGRSHKTEVNAEFTVRRPDGSIREIRRVTPPPQPPDMCKIEVRNKDGCLTDMKEFPVKSFVENWSEVLYHSTIPGTANFTDTGGTARSSASPAIAFEAADDDDDYGIWVGTGDTAVAVSDYTLDTKIAHGVGAGQLDYGQNLYIAATMGGTDIVYKVYRTFTNSSSGEITIKEVGIVADVSIYHVLILRDVEDANGAALSVSVPVGQTATIMYTFTQTQASGFCKQYLQLSESMHWNQAVAVKYVGGGGATVEQTMREIPALWLKLDAGAGNFAGVVVGSGDSALDSEDYELETYIAHGSGSGELSYTAVGNEDLSVDGGDITFIIKRVITNLSGATVTIEEAGLYRYSQASYRYLLVRLLSGTISIPNEHSVTAKFTFKHTV